jgi:hypothetical protein
MPTTNWKVQGSRALSDRHVTTPTATAETPTVHPPNTIQECCPCISRFKCHFTHHEISRGATRERTRGCADRRCPHPTTQATASPTQSAVAPARPQAPAMKVNWACGGACLYILGLTATKWCVVSSTLRLLYTAKKPLLRID